MKIEEYYLFQLELENGAPTIFVYTEDVCDLVQNAQTTKSQYLQKDTVQKKENSLQKVKEIRLDIPPGALKPNIIPVVPG
ncbi:MAG: hypothetical protein JRJ68_01130 [Deltaproteobacteria bacterium]|nr:hypothetical protein [Deltaproteobacteria bacterium]